MKILFLPPGYKRQFKPWVEVLQPEILVSSGSMTETQRINYFNSIDALKILRRFTRREALWMPISLSLFLFLKRKKITKAYFIGEPSYLMNLWIPFLKKRGVKIHIRFAQNMINFLPFPFNYIEQYSIENVDLIFCVAPPSRFILLKKFGDHLSKKVKIISNPIVEDFYKPNFKHVLDERFRTKNILFVGLFEEHKGFDDFLQLKIKKNIKKTVIGEGHLRNTLNMEGVNCHKWMTRNDLIEFYNKASLLVVPSKTVINNIGQVNFINIGWSEQFGRVVVEAQASGVPVLAYDSGALKWVIGKGGVVVPEGDLNSLSDAVNKILSDFTTYKELSEKAFHNSKRFNTEVFTQNLKLCAE